MHIAALHVHTYDNVRRMRNGRASFVWVLARLRCTHGARMYTVRNRAASGWTRWSPAGLEEKPRRRPFFDVDSTRNMYRLGYKSSTFKGISNLP
jgi:hypothetical protein